MKKSAGRNVSGEPSARPRRGQRAGLATKGSRADTPARGSYSRPASNTGGEDDGFEGCGGARTSPIDEGIALAQDGDEDAIGDRR
jgi:hypothetical protein